MKPILRVKMNIIIIVLIKINNSSFDEAIEFSKNKFALGVQWHPESLFEKDENMFKIFKTFIDSAKNK